MAMPKWIKREAAALALCLVIGGILLILATWADIKLTRQVHIHHFRGYSIETDSSGVCLVIFGPYLLLTIGRIGKLAAKMVIPSKLSKQ